MENPNTTLLYFSATYTTKKIVKHIANSISTTVTEYDITNTPINSDINLSNTNDLLIVGMPVYAGRIPSESVESLKKVKSKSNTPAILVCVYGNREYDDALIEMKDIVTENGFKPLSAAAFIAQHSIFPKVATNRPDSADWEIIDKYITANRELLVKLSDNSTIPELNVKGNRPYKIPGKIPITPSGDKRCKDCKLCVQLCPVGAISAENPRHTDSKRCIHCGRCIVVCTENARNFHSILYKIASWKFTKANSVRKEPEIISTESP